VLLFYQRRSSKFGDAAGKNRLHGAFKMLKKATAAVENTTRLGLGSKKLGKCDTVMEHGSIYLLNSLLVLKNINKY